MFASLMQRAAGGIQFRGNGHTRRRRRRLANACNYQESAGGQSDCPEKEERARAKMREKGMKRRKVEGEGGKEGNK